MSFLGYLLKVDGTIIPNKYINISTYNTSPDTRRVLDGYYDGDDIYREILSPHTRSSINFSTNGMLADGKIFIMDKFGAKKNLNIEYWNEITEEYKTGLFKAEDFKISLYKIKGNNRFYQPVGISLIEY